MVRKKKTAESAKYDLGCGPNKIAPDWIGVDVRKFPGVDKVWDLRKHWPIADESADELHSSHFLEHLEPMERVHFVNEAYRVLKPGCQIRIIVPHWASARAYGDLTHKWPPVSEMWVNYLNKAWRAANAPHNDFYTCDFDSAGGHSMHPDLNARNAEFQQYAMRWFKEACSDSIIILSKR